MFRNLKKRIKHMGSGSGGARSANENENDNNNNNNDAIFNTPRRTPIPSSSGGCSGAPSSHSGAPSNHSNSNSNSNHNNNNNNNRATSSSSTGAATNSNKNNIKQQLRKQQQHDHPDDDWMVTHHNHNQTTSITTTTTHLSNFDKCIETSDALTASSSAGQSDTVLAVRKDDATGLPDCSLLVSPDGDLLLVPTGLDQRPEAMFRTLRRKQQQQEDRS